MGKLKITGRAERKVTCDTMEISLMFVALEKTTAFAAAKVGQYCDEFLTILQNNGIDISSMRLEKENLDTSDAGDDEQDIAAALRKVSLKMPYNMAFLNQLNELISVSSYDIYFETDFSISNQADIGKELLKEAVEDSRAKAQMLVDMMGQKIIGIEEVTTDNFSRQYACYGAPPSGALEKVNSISNQLQAPERNESVRIEVIWNIE